jgi:hypothetical protein
VEIRLRTPTETMTVSHCSEVRLAQSIDLAVCDLSDYVDAAIKAETTDTSA